MEHISPTSNVRKVYAIGIAICVVALLAFIVFLTINPALAETGAETENEKTTFGLDIAVKNTGISSGKNIKIETFIGRGIKAVTGMVGVVFLVLMLYAGLMWMTAHGNVEQATKAKDTIVRAVIGLVIIASAYAFTSFVIDRVTGGSNSGSGQTSDQGQTTTETPSTRLISCSNGFPCESSADCGTGENIGICVSDGSDGFSCLCI